MGLSCMSQDFEVEKIALTRYSWPSIRPFCGSPADITVRPCQLLAFSISWVNLPDVSFFYIQPTNYKRYARSRLPWTTCISTKSADWSQKKEVVGDFRFEKRLVLRCWVCSTLQFEFFQSGSNYLQLWRWIFQFKKQNHKVFRVQRHNILWRLCKDTNLTVWSDQILRRSPFGDVAPSLSKKKKGNTKPPLSL